MGYYSKNCIFLTHLTPILGKEVRPSLCFCSSYDPGNICLYFAYVPVLLKCPQCPLGSGYVFYSPCISEFNISMWQLTETQNILLTLNVNGVLSRGLNLDEMTFTFSLTIKLLF